MKTDTENKLRKTIAAHLPPPPPGAEAGDRVVALSEDKGVASLLLDVTGLAPAAHEKLKTALETDIKKIAGIRAVQIAFTAEKDEKDAPDLKSRAPGPPEKRPIPGVKTILAVASGKGGVGKSTVAVNLAMAFQKAGLATGLLDADIYGPSVPTLLGINERPKPRDNKIVPPETRGLKVMSMGFMVETEAPMIWRGPMVAGAVQQLMNDVAWAPLDILVVDMPPGTGDAQLTLAQRVPVSGAVIVSTPQDIALIDARKGLKMFETVGVPVMGIIENMSHFVCPHCGKESHPFGHGGARETADRLGAHFLGEIPLTPMIRELSDSGRPVVESEPESAEAQSFLRIAETITERLHLNSGKDE